MCVLILLPHYNFTFIVILSLHIHLLKYWRNISGIKIKIYLHTDRTNS